MFPHSRPLLLAALLPLLACGGDSSSPTEPPTPGDPPTLSAVVLGGVSSGNVPLPITVRVTVGGDSLARLLVLFEGQADTVTPISALVFDVKDTVRAVGAHSATVILQSAAGRADTAVLAVTGTNPLPVITGATLSADSTEVTDSVRLRVVAHDNRGGVSVVTEFEGVRDSTYSPDTLLTRDRWLRRGAAGSVPVQVRVRDADGGLAEVGRSARFFVIPPSAELRVPVRADTAPLIIAATVLLHRATVAYDSVRIDVADGKSRLFTGLGRVDSVTVLDTLTEVGVTGVTARWYHPSGTALLKDSVEVLLAPNAPPSGGFTALADTVLEGAMAPFQLTFSDDRGVRSARVYRLRGDSTELLQTIPLNDAKNGSLEFGQVLASRHSDTTAVDLEDRDGATIRLMADPVYTDGPPILSGATIGPARGLYRDGVPLLLQLGIQDEGMVQCAATSSLGTTVNGGDSLPIPVRNPTAIEDSLRVTASVTCTDARGQQSQIQADTATLLHADVGRIVLIDVTTGARVDRSLSVNGETFVSQGQQVGLGFRGVASLQVKDLATKWTALVRGDSVTRYDANGILKMPFVDGDVDTLYLIPNTPEGIQAAKDASLLISHDSGGRVVTRYLPNLDVDPAPGIQLAADYWDFEHFSRDRPDSTQVSMLQLAQTDLMAQVAPLLPASRRVGLVQADSGTPVVAKYAYEQNAGAMNIWGPGATTLFQTNRYVLRLDTSLFFPCVSQVVALGVHWWGVGFRDGSGPLAQPVDVLVQGKGVESRAFLERYFSFDSCQLTNVGRQVFVYQAIFGNRTIDFP